MKTYFKTGGFDSLIQTKLHVKTEKREGSSANHVVYTDENKGLADHTVNVEGVHILVPEYVEGYATNKVDLLYFSKEAILSLADQINKMQGVVVNVNYHELDDDLPF